MTETGEDTTLLPDNNLTASVGPQPRARGGSLSLKGRPQTPPKLDGEVCFAIPIDRPPTPPADTEELEWFVPPERGYHVHDESSVSVSERSWLFSEDFARAMRFTAPATVSLGSDAVVDTVMQYIEEQRKNSVGYFLETKGFHIAPTTDATGSEVKFYTISSKNKWSVTAPFKSPIPSGCGKINVDSIRVRVKGEWFRITDLFDHLYSEADWTRHKYRLHQRETWVYDFDPQQEMLDVQRKWWDSNGKTFRFMDLPIKIQKRICRVGLGLEHNCFTEELSQEAFKTKGVD
ncbi:hypothetical protein BDV96DRAFT_666985 [Lophiotrema nucula]|uniref:Uncharacterized protein n=1 Tax=Lophiotrema nucula TaxID=690887 RepID=A0A6A5YU20_9PLEO|nr:hypothetical protein BDV96DRAFT_666985 [Lophiotrema nucula]